MQTLPTAALPFAIPLTLQITVASEVFVTAAENVARPFTASDALGGATLTTTPLVTVTLAETDATPATAWIVTGLVAGKSAGAT